MDFKRGVNIRKLRFEYEDRERECVLSLLSGVLHQNPYLEEFELISTSAYSLINVNMYIENFEDVVLGRSLRKLTLRDSLKYTERTRFAEEGTSALEEMVINKTILNQKNFRLSDNIRVLKLIPVNYSSDTFEISFDQFVFVIENLQYNTTLEHFEMGIRHGNMKKKIFNAILYEKERRVCTKRLANALVKVFAHNQTLKNLYIQYKHANFDECIKIGHHLINSRRQGLNRVDTFNGFAISNYLADFTNPESWEQSLQKVLLHEKERDFDDATFDPLYCGLIVALIVDSEQSTKPMREIHFNTDEDAIQKY